MPGMPASVKNSAHTDHRYAATTPTEMRVSIVAAPWRRLASAARWNGHAPQITTGEASARASHCQSSNCSAGTIDSRSTGTLSAAETSSRRRHAAVASGLLRWHEVVGGRAQRRGVAGRLDRGHQVVRA